MNEEVQFTRELPLVGKDLLQDVLCTLAKKNDYAVNHPEEFQDHLSHGQTVEFIFQACTRWDLPLPAHFLAVEYFDRFLVRHIRDLRQDVATSNGPRITWESVMERVSEQVVLRALSCIQIASKMVSSGKAVTLKDVHALVKSSGHVYSMNSVLMSELRVLRTLDYRLQIDSPLDFIEILLDIISCNDADFSPKDVYPVALQLLRAFYFMRKEIYAKTAGLLRFESSQGSQDSSRTASNTFASDKLLLAAAILVTAVRLRTPKKHAQVEWDRKQDSRSMTSESTKRWDGTGRRTVEV
ncbi:cyclin N-terminal domain-containing protein 1-like isoform X2 [Ornithodoros turicata]|uniref:cyclin N-terminal domain-containing protein 1-like isoform X2 n=1 Tax=Ornithodoros turicata TaxID=34597 RepID=UPI003138D9D7